MQICQKCFMLDLVIIDYSFNIEMLEQINIIIVWLNSLPRQQKKMMDLIQGFIISS